MDAKHIVFIVENLSKDSFFGNLPSTRHPWGCLVTSDTNIYSRPSLHLLCLLGFSHNCSNDTKEHCTVFGTKPVEWTCLIHGCASCTLPSDVQIKLDSQQSITWITFDPNLLAKIHRLSLANVLDQLNLLGDACTDPKQFLSRLHQIQSSALRDQYGCALGALIEFHSELCSSPMFRGHMQPRGESSAVSRTSWLAPICHRIVSLSHSARLVQFHLNQSVKTHRLRGLLPRDAFNDELVHTNSSLLYELVLRAYSSHRLPEPALSVWKGLDPGLILLGAAYLLLLLLSLLAPASFTTCPTASFTEFDQFWLFSAVNCSRVPTLGWFYLNTTVTTDSEHSLSHNSVVLPERELFRTLSANASPGCWLPAADQWIEFFTCELTRIIMWLESGQPAGLKINRHLSRLLGHFFLYHILAWRMYASFTLRLAAFLVRLLQSVTEVHSLDERFTINLSTVSCLLLGTVFVATSRFATGSHLVRLPSRWILLLTFVSSVFRLTLALIACILLDFVNMVSIHLTTFYLYTMHFLRFQVRTLTAAWRLSRNASKWNPLRARVDYVPDMYSMRTSIGQGDCSGAKQDTHFDRLFVATVLGLAVSLCLLPTTLAFYVTFASVRLLTAYVQLVLRRCAAFVLDVPISSMFAWMLGLDRSRTELNIVAPTFPDPRFPMLHLKMKRPGFLASYENNRLLHKRDLFSIPVRFSDIIRGLLSVKEV